MNERRRGFGFRIWSIWETEHYRRVKKGSLYEWIEASPRTRDGNIVVNQGLNSVLDIMFHNATQIATWYVALIGSNTPCTSGLTYAVPGFTEATGYDEATRPAYVEAAASSQSITNSANKAVFTISDSITAYGGALVGGGSAASTKSDTAGGGTMFCASLFGTARNLFDDDVFSVTVTINTADA